MLTLGEFTMDGFEGHPDKTYMMMCYVFFLFATFFSQIIILNMLIAIMGNTFAMVVEQKRQYSMQTKLELMADYCFISRIVKKYIGHFPYCIKISGNIGKETKNTNKYLFIVEPILDEEEK